MSPIGSFDAFWENYDHRQGPVLVQESKERYKVGATAPNWRLRIGDKEMTNRLISAEVTFSAEGESAMRFTLSSQIQKREYERARVYLWIGYGTKLVPFFWGRIERPMDSKSGLYSEVSAYGRATQMGQRYFGGRVSYADMDLEAAWFDLVGRVGGDPDRYEFQAGSTTLEGDMESFGLEHTLLEAEQAILEPLGLKGIDQPGGMHVVKRPFRMDTLTRAGLSGYFGEDSYPQGGFTFSDSFKNYYGKVVILRRTEEFAGGGSAGAGAPGMIQVEDGSWVPRGFFGSDAENLSNSPLATEYAVYAERPVANTARYDVQEGRAYMVPDFPGTQIKAEEEADSIAAGLSAGIGSFSFECDPFDIALYDHFGVETKIEDRQFDLGSLDFTSVGSLWGVLYACRAEEVTLTLAQSEGQERSWSMTISGAAAERERWLIRAADPAHPINLGVSPGVTSAPPATRGVISGTDQVLSGADRVVV